MSAVFPLAVVMCTALSVSGCVGQSEQRNGQDAVVSAWPRDGSSDAAVVSDGSDVSKNSCDGRSCLDVDFAETLNPPLDQISGEYDTSLCRCAGGLLSELFWHGGATLATAHGKNASAIAMGQGGVDIVEFTEPLLPVWRGRLFSSSESRDVLWHEDVLFVFGPESFVVYDMSDLDSPIEVSTVVVGGCPADAELVGDTLFVLYFGSSCAEFGFGWMTHVVLRAYSVADPSQPMPVGEIQISDGSTGPGKLALHAVSGTALVCSGSLSVVDVSDPTEMAVVGAYGLPGGEMEGFCVSVASTPQGFVSGFAVSTSSDFCKMTGETYVHDVSVGLAPKKVMETEWASWGFAYGGDTLLALGCDVFHQIPCGALPPLAQTGSEVDATLSAFALDPDNGLDVADLKPLWTTDGMIARGLPDLAVRDALTFVARPNEGLNVFKTTVGQEAPVALAPNRPPTRAEDVFVELPLVYVAAGADGLYVVDVANDDSPTTLGRYRTEQDSSGQMTKVVVKEDIAYVAVNYADGSELWQLDVSVPQEPGLLAKVGYVNAQIVALAGGEDVVVYVYADGTLRLLDAGIQGASPKLGSVHVEGEIRSASVFDGIAYIAAGEAGVHAVAVMDPPGSGPAALVNTIETPCPVNDVFVDDGVGYVACDGEAVSNSSVLFYAGIDTQSPELMGETAIVGRATALDGWNGLVFVAAEGYGVHLLEIDGGEGEGVLDSYQTPGIVQSLTVAEGHIFAGVGSKGMLALQCSCDCR